MELVARGHQVLALPMLGAALAWRDRVAGVPTAAPLAGILADCCERLLSLLQRYVSDMARARPPSAPHLPATARGLTGSQPLWPPLPLLSRLA